MEIDKYSSVPLYAQLKALITERIDSGVYPEGEQIPTEMAFCKELQLSRPTVRQAIAELVAEGLLVIMKGKGTFVRTEAKRLNIAGFSAFKFSFLSGQSLEQKQFVDYRRLDFADLSKDQQQIFALNKSGNERGFYEVIWTERQDHQVYVLCHSLIPAAMFPSLTEDIHDRKSMIDITANRYPLLPQRANWRIFYRPSNQPEARTLDMNKGAAVLVSEAVFQSRNGSICESSVATLRADICMLKFDPSSK
ncbi:MAG: GntR family transcriptional regulator [Oscillospiraceae bacterium]|nr:GntR family transcriptional regulator [Oscillospiraceae bacterium]MDD4368003.1 GntR family transcriptional regulator [Oscillospiraceae bacterium]